MNARPYQLECMTATHAAFATHQRVLDVLPTGAGKTCIFSWMAEAFAKEGKRTLILAHRDELVKQAAAKLLSTTGIYGAIEKAEHRASRNAQVVVGSVQTLKGSRLGNWPQDHFGLVVADEAHHVLAAGWQQTLRHFSTAKVLGVTATPNRSDKKNLGSYFQTVAYEIGLFDLIHQNFLSPIVIKSVPLRIDLSRVGMEKGDYAVAGLGTALDPYLPAIAAQIKKHAPFRRILIFCPLIATSQKMNAAMLAEGFISEHVSGESEDRAEILKRFETGETECLTNAMLLTEGYDNPAVDCVINLRLTKSESLYSQIIGRGTRVCVGKQNLLVMDFLWAHEKHKLCRPADLIAEDDETADAITEASQSPMFGDEQIDLEGLAKTVQEQRERKLAKELERNKNKEARAEQMMKTATEVANKDWGNDGPQGPHSFKQRKLLVQFGIDPTGLTKAEASQIIGEKFASKRNQYA